MLAETVSDCVLHAIETKSAKHLQNFVLIPTLVVIIEAGSIYVPRAPHVLNALMNSNFSNWDDSRGSPDSRCSRGYKYKSS